MRKDEAAKAARVALNFADEMFAEADKRGLVVGSCYLTQAQAALEIAGRISEEAGLPRPKARATGARCHWGGGLR